MKLLSLLVLAVCFITLHASHEDLTQYASRIDLHRAAMNNNVNAINILIRAGKDVNCQDEKGNTPLHFAIAYRHNEAIRVLAKYANPDIANNQGITPRMLARNGGSIQECIERHDFGARYIGIKVDPQPEFLAIIERGATAAAGGSLFKGLLSAMKLFGSKFHKKGNV